MTLLQGSWQDSTGEIYYIRGDSCFTFEDERFYHSVFQLSHDTLIDFSPAGYFKSVHILRLTKDSLLATISTSDERLTLFRPTEESLRKDTVTVVPDSIYLSFDQRIHDQLFEFSHRSDYEDHIFLRVGLKNCSDSCIKLQHDLFMIGGDCNTNSETESVYELRQDTLIFYTKDYYDEHMSDNDHHVSTDYIKEVFLVHPNGSITELKLPKTKRKTALEKEVVYKLEKLEWR